MIKASIKSRNILFDKLSRLKKGEYVATLDKSLIKAANEFDAEGLATLKEISGVAGSFMVLVRNF